MNEQELNIIQRAKTIKTNDVAGIANMNGKTYITPEDVTKAFEDGIDENKVRLDVLEILSGGTGFGVEDKSATAFVAFEGKEKNKFAKFLSKNIYWIALVFLTWVGFAIRHFCGFEEAVITILMWGIVTIVFHIQKITNKDLK
jgi:hypothetical protein